jgi:hypothetical protein
VRENKWNSRYCHIIEIPEKQKEGEQVEKNRNEITKKKKLVLNIAYDLPTISFFLFCWKKCRYMFCGWFAAEKCGKYILIQENELLEKFLPLHSTAVQKCNSSKLNIICSI